MSCRHMSAFRVAKVDIGWMEEIRYFVSVLGYVTRRLDVRTLGRSALAIEYLLDVPIAFDSSALSF